MVYKYKVLFIICFLFSSTVTVNADCDDFYEGLELFDKKFYVLAQSFYEHIIYIQSESPSRDNSSHVILQY